MAQKITITLPNELFDGLQTVKKQFNISKICQIAIKREIERQRLHSEELAIEEYCNKVINSSACCFNRFT